MAPRGAFPSHSPDVASMSLSPAVRRVFVEEQSAGTDCTVVRDRNNKLRNQLVQPESLNLLNVYRLFVTCIMVRTPNVGEGKAVGGW